MTKKKVVQPISRLRGKPKLPGDKSISHRALIFGALAEGRTEITNILEGGDVHSTADCLKRLGIVIEKSENKTIVHGVGSRGIRAQAVALDCGNSGTTIRLLMGVLAGSKVRGTLSGDSSLVRRPMKRVAEPLKQMGAEILLSNGDYAPLTVQGAPLAAIHYDLKVASAQIKSAIILAALSADGLTTLTGKIQSRDHTERMLRHFGAELDCRLDQITIRGGQRLVGTKVEVPGDPSAAAFWMAAASLIPGAHIIIENMSINPSRIGFLRALEKMGAKIQIEVTTKEPEPIGRVEVVANSLRGVRIGREEIPALIDEIPLLAILATQAQGVTEIEGAEELRVKESDRIEAVATNLRAMGADVEVRRDGFRIKGKQKLRGAQIQTYHDHRIAMAFSIAGLVAEGPTEIIGSECVAISYPNFFETLKELTHE